MCSTSGFWMHPEELEAMKNASKMGEYQCNDCGRKFRAVKKSAVSCPSCHSTNTKFIKGVL